jgi:protein-tyrosine kinase
VSLVDKALKHLKTQQREIAPLGKFQTAEELSSSDALERANGKLAPGHSAGSEPGTLRIGVRTITVDRNRLQEEGFLAPEKYERQLADEYRRIKRPLIANAISAEIPRTDRANLILVSSAVAGEGKTHTCLNLALSLSTERDRTVLLVDGDVPKPHISRLFGVADQPGLLDALGDQALRLEDLLIRTDIPRLSMLPAGRWNDHAPELLASERMDELCGELARRYPDRIVLFDSPPLLAATEAQAISGHVGQVVLVIAENTTACNDVRSALASLDRKKPINAVLNKSRRATLGGYYYGGYGYGSHGDVNAGQQGSEAGRP